jgi:hypothetical protein
MRPRIFVPSAGLLFIGTLMILPPLGTLPRIDTAHAVCDDCGGPPPPPPPPSTHSQGGSAISSGRGSHRGHRTNILIGYANWLASRTTFTVQSGGAFGGPEGHPFSLPELEYLCSMQKILRGQSDEIKELMFLTIAEIIDRPEDRVTEALEDPLLCPGV